MRDISGCIPENERALVSAILQSVTGCETDSIEHIKGIGMNNAVSVATTRRGRFVVRTNVEPHLFRFQREAWCYQQLQGTPVLTPTVLGCGLCDGYSYSVAEFIAESAPISERVDQLRVWRTLGFYARLLNQIPPPRIGTEAASYFPATWEQQVLDDVALIFKDDLWLTNGLLSSSAQDRAREYLLDCGSSGAPLGICQFDLTTANAVICNGDYERVYLLDLESANVAPVPDYQLGCIAAEKGLESDVTRVFFEGYGVDIGAVSPRIEQFTLYRLMRATAWARDRQPSLLGENIARTQPLLKRILERDFC